MMLTARNLLDWSKWTYLTSGIVERWRQARRCPSCGGDGPAVDRKYFHSLHQCAGCCLVFRYPHESTSEMTSFYENDYSEPGLTTELPSEAVLADLLSNNFRGSAKDFSYIMSVLRAAGLQPGQRLLDYGANWGYATYQFRKAGFSADGLEISTPRARFARKLGLEIATDARELRGGYDMVYSCHVLEHVPNPRETIRQQLALTRSGGLVIGHTPNGSAAWRVADPGAFHRLWGKVHPVLLTDEFIRRSFSNYVTYVSSSDQPEQLREWDQKCSFVGDTSARGLFFVIVNHAA